MIDRVSTLAQTYQFIFEQQISAASLDTVAIDNSEIEAYALVTRNDIINGDRYYSETTKKWAEGYTGYMEQQFGPHQQGDI